MNCHLNDGYICSSKYVKPLVELNPSDWERSILLIAEPIYVRTMEAKYLVLINARDDKMSFNRHNGDMKFHTIGSKLTEEHKKKLSRKGRVVSSATKSKLSSMRMGDKNPFFGKTHTKEYAKQISVRVTNNNPSKRPDVKQKLSDIFKGRDISFTRTPEALAKRSTSLTTAWSNGSFDKRKKANWIPTVEQKLAMSVARSKQSPPTLGKKHSLESKAKMAESRRQYWVKRRQESL